MKTGFIGCGNMGGAIIAGLVKGGTDPSEIIAADPSEGAREKMRASCGIRTTAENLEAVKDSEVVVLAVKPVYLDGVLEEIRGKIPADTLVVSIVAGRRLSYLREQLGEGTKVVRVMPNTPALVGEGIAGFSAGEGVTKEDKEKVRQILGAVGSAEEVPERLMDCVTSVGGSAPAFVYMFIEALADAAVLDGMPRDMALRFAAQTVKGSAALVQSDGRHPGALKDMVCSPGGTTIEGVRVLEEKGFRSAVIEAAHAAAKKAAEL